jgi:hypothetical protein
VVKISHFRHFSTHFRGCSPVLSSTPALAEGLLAGYRVLRALDFIMSCDHHHDHDENGHATKKRKLCSLGTGEVVHVLHFRWDMLLVMFVVQ